MDASKTKRVLPNHSTSFYIYPMSNLESILIKHQHTFSTVVPFHASADKLLLMDFTKNNTSLSEDILKDTEKFCTYISNLLGNDYAYGIGGYNEHRTIYARSHHFDSSEEPRRLHLGIDIWGKVGTPVFAPLGGTIHSFAFNNNYGDYGATIILQHQLDTVSFHTLYGHLSQRDIGGMRVGQYMSRGEAFAHFGPPKENGNWPPHLHFQIVEDMHEHIGDYHGVCKFSEREKWLANCPNPDSILRMMQYAV